MTTCPDSIDEIFDICAQKLDDTDGDFEEVIDFIIKNEIDHLDELISWMYDDMKCEDLIEENKDLFRYTTIGMLVGGAMACAIGLDRLDTM